MKVRMILKSVWSLHYFPLPYGGSSWYIRSFILETESSSTRKSGPNTDHIKIFYSVDSEDRLRIRGIVKFNNLSTDRHSHPIIFAIMNNF